MSNKIKMASEELKPCSACNGDPKLHNLFTEIFNGKEIYEYMIVCLICHLRTSNYDLPREAIKAWNRRA